MSIRNQHSIRASNKPNRNSKYENVVPSHLVNGLFIRAPIVNIKSVTTQTPALYSVSEAYTYLNLKASTENKITRYDNEKPKKNKGLLQRFSTGVFSYLKQSTLHGLRYVGDAELTVVERVFWMIAFLVSVVFSAYFILSLYAKFNDNPVIISFNPTSITLSAIPFPAVTICNANKVLKRNGENIIKSGSIMDKQLLADYCDFNQSFEESIIDPNLKHDSKLPWNVVKKFLVANSASCEEMILQCSWMGNDCKENINPVLTDEGFCCAFNRLPTNYTFRNVRSINDLNETYPSIIIDWSLEDGYPANSNLSALPMRTTGSGVAQGLTLVMDAIVEEHYCSSTSSTGFKALLSHPVETPRVADYGFMISPGTEKRVVIDPSIRDASDNVKSINLLKRRCYFGNERYLQFYRRYTERNCKLECIANFTLEKCSCVSYYLPKNASSPICGKNEDECSLKAKEIIDSGSQGEDACNCLPSCFELSYGTTSSDGKLTLSAVKSQYLNGLTPEYFITNVAVVHFYFKESKFTKQSKSILYGFSEFLSNTGGLLGFFLGFSFLSAIEICYYLLMKPAIHLINMKSTEKVINKSKREVIPYRE